jgi:CBS domain-containing protein
MKVKDAMTKDVRVVDPDETVRQAALTMAIDKISRPGGAHSQTG